MLPVYREGDNDIVSPSTSIRKGDRVIARTTTGEVLARILHRQSAKTVELASFNPADEIKSIDMKDIDWIARIIWAAQ
jgi:phage repressor protein C with HTH and peptisase S24 domain